MKNKHLMIGDAVVGKLLITDNLLLENIVTNKNNIIEKSFIVNSAQVVSKNNSIKLKKENSQNGIIIDENGFRFGKVSTDENGNDFISSDDSKILADFSGNLSFESGTIGTYTSIGGWYIGTNGLQYPQTNPYMIMYTEPLTSGAYKDLYFRLGINSTTSLFSVDKNGVISGTFKIPDGAIGEAEIKDRSVDGSSFAASSVSGGNLQTTIINIYGSSVVQSIHGSKVNVGTITSNKIKNSSISFYNLKPSAIADKINYSGSTKLNSLNFSSITAIISDKISASIINSSTLISDKAISKGKLNVSGFSGEYYIRKSTAQTVYVKFVDGLLTSTQTIDETG